MLQPLGVPVYQQAFWTWNGVKITPKRRFFLPALFFTCFCSKNVNEKPFEILRRQIFLPFHTRQLIKCLPAFTKMNLLGGASPYRPLKEVPPRPFVRDLTKFHTLHAWLIFTMQTTSKLTLNSDVLLYLDYILATPRLLRGVAGLRIHPCEFPWKEHVISSNRLLCDLCLVQSF